MNKIKNINLKDKEVLHAHFSGINYGEKGEKNHILTGEKAIKEFLHYLKKYNISINIINESPDPLRDASKMKKIFGEMK
jgi:deoxyribonuclease-4